MNSTNCGRGFMRGLQLRHFLDTTAEWHALVQGLCEVTCPWPPRHKLMDEELADEIRTEHHYYMAGRVLGFASLVLFSVLAVALIHAIVA